MQYADAVICAAVARVLTVIVTAACRRLFSPQLVGLYVSSVSEQLIDDFLMKVLERVRLGTKKTVT